MQLELAGYAVELAVCEAAERAGEKALKEGVEHGAERAAKKAATKAAKLGVKGVPIIGWAIAGGIFGWDWYSGGFGHACNELVWPVSEFWTNGEEEGGD